MGFDFENMKSIDIHSFCALEESGPVPDLTRPPQDYLPALNELKPYLPEATWASMNWNLSQHPSYKSKEPPGAGAGGAQQQPQEQQHLSLASVNSTSSRNRVVISLTTSPERMWEVSWLLFMFLRLQHENRYCNLMWEVSWLLFMFLRLQHQNRYCNL